MDIIDKTYAQHDQYLMEFIKAQKFDEIYNDQQLAAIVDCLQKTRLNLQTFEKSLPLELFVTVNLSLLSTLISFQSEHEGKYTVIKALNTMKQRILDSLPKVIDD